MIVMPINDVLLEEVLFYQIDRTIKLARAYTVKAFAEAGFDLTVDQWLILKKIADGEGPINQTELGQLLNKDNASITRTLDLLVKKSWLERRRNAADRRAYDLVLTAAGKELVQTLLPLVKSIRAVAVQGLGNDALTSTRQTLVRIQENLS